MQMLFIAGECDDTAAVTVLGTMLDSGSCTMHYSSHFTHRHIDTPKGVYSKAPTSEAAAGFDTQRSDRVQCVIFTTGIFKGRYPVGVVKTAP